MSIQCPKISVIMSTYNDAKYLYESISSILNQSFTDFEFIIVNDASTDDTANILANLAAKDQRLRILTNTENKERCISRNRAINAAQADYIAVMDADDWAYPERLAKQYAFMEQNPLVSICGAQIRIHELDFLSLKIMPWRIYPCSNEEIRKRMFSGCCFYHPTIIMRKEHILKYTHGYDESSHTISSEDYDLWARLMVHSDIVLANMPEILLKYRINPFNDRSKIKKQQDANAKKIKLKLRQELGVPAHLLGCSVITIVYNGAKYMEKCITSILSQRFMDFEYIIVDDASTDGTKSILAELAEKDKRIRIITNTEHKGYFFSLDVAMLAAKSPYLAIMDADTSAHPERLALQYNSMQANKKISICGAQMHTDAPTKLAEQNEQEAMQADMTAFSSKPATNYSLFFKHNICFPTFMLRKDYILAYLEDCVKSHASDKNCDFGANIVKDNMLIFANRPEILVQYSIQQDQERAAYYEMQPHAKALMQQHLQQHLSKIYYLKMRLSPLTTYIANILEKILPKFMLSPLRLLYNEAKKLFS